MNFSNLRIGTLMGLAFGSLLLLTTAMLGLALHGLGQMGSANAALAADLATTRFMLYGLFVLTVLCGIGLSHGLTRAITEPLGEAIMIAETVASGDLSQEFSTERGGEFGRLIRALGNMEDTLTDLVGQIKTSSDSISVASQAIAKGNTDLAQRTEEQAASVEETTSSMQQLTNTVLQNSERADSASGLAGHASNIAERGGEVVGQVVRTMEVISNSSRQIGDIIAVIDGIAFQTNILALNAAVEAARAGEQGRGFAVVASEVRSLAQRSATAAKEIGQLIGDSVRHVGDGAQLVNQAGQTMQEIVQEVKRVTSILGEIATASVQQREGLQQVNLAISHLDGVTQHNVTQVEQAAQAALELAKEAQHLDQVIGAFKLG